VPLPDDELVRCPKCGGADIRKSRRNTLVDSMMSIFSFSALRCRNCRNRFYRRLWEDAEEEAGHQQAE
jgi:uncharacterized protein with PIN domain